MEKITVKGTFQAYFPSRNPGQFDAFQHGKIKKEVGKIFIKDYTLGEYGLLNPFKWMAYKIKPFLLKQHKKALPEPYSDLYTGLIFGIHGTSLPSTLKELFRKSRIAPCLSSIWITGIINNRHCLIFHQ